MENEELFENEDIEYPEEWKDGSDISCSDCPDDECTGHCFSCSYRSF